MPRTASMGLRRFCERSIHEQVRRTLFPLDLRRLAVVLFTMPGTLADGRLLLFAVDATTVPLSLFSRVVRLAMSAMPDDSHLSGYQHRCHVSLIVGAVLLFP